MRKCNRLKLLEDSWAERENRRVSDNRDGWKTKTSNLVHKIFQKVSHKIKDGTIKSESRELTRELKTLKRTWSRYLLLATTSEFFFSFSRFYSSLIFT